MTNSRGAYNKMINFSNEFIKKWGPVKSKNFFEMKIDYDIFYKRIYENDEIYIEYIDKKFFTRHIQPIHIIYDKSISNYVSFISKYNEITKAIFRNNPQNLIKALTESPDKVYEKIGPCGLSLLHIASMCPRGPYKNLDAFKDNLQIINLLMMYGLNKNDTD
jgi:hypothetical protein